MKVLVVFAHPEPRSFTGALRDAAIQTLLEEGHEVVQSDLYQMPFNPVPGWHDFQDHDQIDYFGYSAEQKRATEGGTFAPDLRVEMDKVSACDLLLFIFPLWWYSMPAIMKGWVDRVFAYGFAYGGGRWFDAGVFKGKQAMLAVNIGGPESAYNPDGLQGGIDQILFPIHHGILAYTGFQVHEPFVAFSGDAGKREAVLDTFVARIRDIQVGQMLASPRLAEYDENYRRSRPE